MDEPTAPADSPVARPIAPTVVYRHRLATRIWHWINAIAIFVMIGSGIGILNAHPRLYWGQYGAKFDHAWLDLRPYGNILRSGWLQRRVTIGRKTLLTAQGLLGIYGGYFGGGVGLMTTATYGLLAGHTPRELFAPRTLMLAVANLAAAFVFIAAGMVRWIACLPMLAGSILGGWAGAHIGKKLPASAVRVWTLLVTGVTTIVFFARAYG